MTAPQIVLTLIENFERNLDTYRNGKYNETQVRLDFINPFFKALGWDMDNSAGYAEAYRDVIHEDAIKVGISTKAPDYSFRIGGQRKFFLEAKKPSVNVKDDVEPAFQLRRYAWSAKLPLSIVTDFEEFAVYDCRQKPDKSDKASKSRLFYFTFRDYAEKWDEIAAIFSKDAVLKGSFDKYAISNKGKRGTTEVDSAFLEEIENWRNLLAHNIALRNDSLSQRELNFAVQQTIDRIIFLRICEDRGIEPYGRLMALQNGVNVYGRLRELFRAADDRYNSGLFHFKREKGREEAPDELTLHLDIDDKPLKEIFKNLYYPDCPYEFSVLGADILGSVYEQFLGKVIRLTAGNRAVVEDKPEVKKAGGVYYTPTYIVDYIVAHTVGKLLEGKTSKQAAGITILDPACGSGSFLIGAYQYLLDWYLKQYLEDGADKYAKGKSARLYQGTGGAWRLTTAEKKRILLEHIYGVDIDTQAVEVTKLSLLLKVLEGESGQTLNAQMKLFHERVLPDLAHNIQCGNSLIGPDFYDGQLELDDKAAQRINVFDWQAAFPQVFKAGGFDAVIGNPPYYNQIPSDQHDYYSKHYQHQDYQLDLYLLFLERYHALLKANSLLGIIVSNTWLQSIKLRKIRQYLVTDYAWQRILHLPEKVFKAVVDTHVLIFRKASSKIIASQKCAVDIRRDNVNTESNILKQSSLPSNGDPINILASTHDQALIEKILKNSYPLAKFCDVFNGVKPFENGKGIPPQTEEIMRDKPFVVEGERPNKKWSPLLRGSLIQRYINLWNSDYWISYGEWLAAPRNPAIFAAREKIMVRQTGDSLIATLIPEAMVARNNLHVLIPKDTRYSLTYILGLLNSRLLDFSYTFINPEKGEALAEVKKHHVEQLPIREINFDNAQDKSKYDKLVALVEKMLALHQQLAAAKTPQDTTLLQRQIDATDKQIDQLVYTLYGLTEEEIALVEGSA